MLKVNALGKNLHVLINTEYTYFGDWTAFCCWYSLSKMLPDAEIHLKYVPKGKTAVFQWPGKVGVSVNKPEKYPLLLLESTIAAVRQMDSLVKFFNSGDRLELTADEFCDVGTERYLPFVSYKNGCGNFVTAQWINSMECPFSWADRYMTHSVTPNEVHILRLWKQISSIYATVSRGS